MAEARGPLHRVLGTAGHIDHGKTSLVRALTGTNTDRLPEEKKRGITIELGFARWDLDGDLSASIIDVPGHEKLVRTMVSGAAGIDALLLVVAADDGVMPQTSEHLAVARLLGVKRGLVAITKADLVDEDMLALVEEDVALAIDGTFLAGCPIVPTSVETGLGLDRLAQHASAILRDTPAKRDDGPAVLPVDRVFSQAGFGTVVTGTLVNGTLTEGDAVDLVPGPRGEALTGLKVRGLQVHGQEANDAHAGRRVAVNVRGVETIDVHRGACVVSAGSLTSTSAVHVALTLLEDAPPVTENDHLSLHLGAEDVLCRVVPLQKGAIEPGETRAARLVADRPICAFADQRFVVRKPGVHGQGTVGGGRVLDPAPSSGKRSFARWAEVAKRLVDVGDGVDGAALTKRTAALLDDARRDGLDEKSLSQRLPLGTDVPALVDTLVATDRARVVDGRGSKRVVSMGEIRGAADAVLPLVEAFHREHPVLSGIAPAELESRLPPHVRGLAGAATQWLDESGAVSISKGAVAQAGFERPVEAVRALEALRAAIDAGGLAPPTEDALLGVVENDEHVYRDALNELVRAGDVVRVTDGLYCTRASLDGLEGRIRKHFGADDTLTTAAFKELSGGLSRKFAIPLLEWLDASGLTRREGDVRKKGPAC
jgi:selenocysteine-specific elongation factor